ncbi:MAG: nucleoside triphosphate pyrophosphohydrolase, partial [Caldimicrobium sp.]
MSKRITFSYHGRADLSSLYDIIAILRGEKGCPWDKKQTPHTLKKYLLEETYEVLEALEKDDVKGIKEELGDLLFILLFIIYLYEERQLFSLKDLVYLTFQKMIRRHPHVFGEEEAKSAEEVLKNWQVIKAKEGKEDSVLGSIPKALPALQRAYRLGERASRVGFDWDSAKAVIPKIYEEIKEIEKRLEKAHSDHLKEEIGDLLFTIANFSRKLEINPEEALKIALDKFERRFKLLEKVIKEEGKSFEDLTHSERDLLWEEIK